MPVILPILKDPFADLGDRAEFPYQPDTMQELLSWKEGYTKPYQRIPEHGGVYIERREFNQVLWLLTSQMIWGFKNCASWDELQAKFMRGTEKGIQQFEVNYMVDEPTFVFVKIECLNPAQAAQIRFLNFELIINDNQSVGKQNPQFVFATPATFSQNEMPQMCLSAFLAAGDRYKITGSTTLGGSWAGQNTGMTATTLWVK